MLIIINIETVSLDNENGMIDYVINLLWMQVLSVGDVRCQIYFMFAPCQNDCVLHNLTLFFTVKLGTSNYLHNCREFILPQSTKHSWILVLQSEFPLSVGKGTNAAAAAPAISRVESLHPSETRNLSHFGGLYGPYLWSFVELGAVICNLSFDK